MQDYKYFKLNNERYLRESYVLNEFLPEFLKKLLTDGRIKIVEGNKEYFSTIQGRPTDIFSDFIPELAKQEQVVSDSEEKDLEPEASNSDSSSVASHSSAVGNSIQQFRDQLLTILYENQDAIKRAKTNKMPAVEVFETTNIYDAVINEYEDLFSIVTNLPLKFPEGHSEMIDRLNSQASNSSNSAPSQQPIADEKDVEVFVPIRVDKGLPIEHVWVVVFQGEIAYDNNYAYGRAYYDGEHWMYFDGECDCVIDNVTHWLKKVKLSELIK